MNNSIAAYGLVFSALIAAYVSLRKDARDAAQAARDVAREVREDFKAAAEKVAQVHTIVNANYDRVTSERDTAQLENLGLKEQIAALQKQLTKPTEEIQSK